MNTFKRTKLRVITLLSCLIMLVMLCILPAKAQVDITTFGTFTNVPSIITTAAVSNSINSQIWVRQERGLSVMPIFAGTNSGTAGVLFTWEVSLDGTNWSTSSGLTYNLLMNGTTAVKGYTNFPPTLLNNVRYIRLGSISNSHSASIFVSNVWYSYHY